MATREYLESQHYDVTLGSTVYEVTVNAGTSVVAKTVQPTLTASDGDDTPSVLNATHLLIPANTAATEITQLANAVAYQSVTIIATSATNPSTITDGGNFDLVANWSPSIDDAITVFTTDGTAWREVSRTTASSSTDLAEGTATVTTVNVNSSTGTNATLVSASNARAGVLTKAKWDEIVVNSAHVAGDGSGHADVATNTAKVTNATHTGDVTGAAALTIAAGAVDIAMMSATGTPSGSTYLRGDNTWASVGAAGTITYKKIIYIEDPTATDSWPILSVGTACTITRVTHITDAGTVDFNLEERVEATPATAGTDVFASDDQASTTNSVVTSFSNAALAAHTWLHYSASAVASSPTKLWVAVTYTED